MISIQGGGGGGDELKLIMQKLDTACWNMIC